MLHKHQPITPLTQCNIGSTGGGECTEPAVQWYLADCGDMGLFIHSWCLIHQLFSPDIITTPGSIWTQLSYEQALVLYVMEL